jgi:uncharacterized protein YjiS (DUF1127 family)
MAQLDIIPASRGISLGLPSIFATVSNAVSAYFENRATRKALGALTDRQLSDIGLSRADIEQMAS